MGDWFVTYLGYEQKQKAPRELIVSFRSLNLGNPKIADIYTNYPLLLSTYNLYSKTELESLLYRISHIPMRFRKVYLPINNHKIDIEAYYPYLKERYGVKIEINPEKECDFFVVQISLPNDPKLINQLPSTKISGFQTEGLATPVKRELNILNRKVTLDERLEEIFIKKDEISNAETEITYLINKLPDEKKHLIRRDLFRFFLTYPEFKKEDILILARTNGFYHLTRYLTNNNPERILDLEKIVVSGIDDIKTLVKEIDKDNSVIPDEEFYIYKIHLQYSSENESTINPLGVKGISFDEHLFDELSKQIISYVDIEKPLWKREHEKILLNRRKSLLELKKSQKYNSQEKQERINKLIREIEEKLMYNLNGQKIPIYEEKYDAKVTNLTLLAKKEDGSLVRQYHKISYNPGVVPDILGYEIFIHDSEAMLLNEFYYQLVKLKPFELSNHNIPYDLIQLREAFLQCKLGKKFSLSTEAKNPRRDIVRKTYQRVKSPGQEIWDTYRLTFNAFPYLKSKFSDGSHKLEDSTRFIRALRKIDRDFKKIATHEELRDLVLSAMQENKTAELELDYYTIADVEEPLRDIAEYELFSDIVFKIKRFMPHVPVTDIMFSPTVMEELHKTLHFKKYHNERYSGRIGKIRRDEKEIFDKRYNVLKTKLLKQNKVNLLHPRKEKNVIQAYIPVELWMSNFLISIFPLWESYFKSLSENPIEKVTMLQPPKYFLKDLLIDYYFYTREKILYKEGLVKINLDKEDTKKLFFNLEQRIISSGKDKLNSYELSFYNLRDHYRSIYKKLPTHVRKAIRIKPWHLYLEREESQSEFPGLGFDLFMHDNLDLVKVKNFPLTMMKQLNDETLTLFKRFNSTFDTLMEISYKLESFIDRETLKLFKERRNFPYLLNLRRKIVARMKNFKLFYGQSVDDFDSAFNKAFLNLADELHTNNIRVLDLQGDYLFIKGNLPKNSMLIPVRTVPNYINEESKKVKDPEPSLFEMLEDNPA